MDPHGTGLGEGVLVGSEPNTGTAILWLLQYQPNLSSFVTSPIPGISIACSLRIL